MNARAWSLTANADTCRFAYLEYGSRLMWQWLLQGFIDTCPACAHVIQQSIQLGSQ